MTKASITTSAIDRVPPHSIEAEQAALGCILLDPKEALPAAIERFPYGTEMFYDLRHQAVYDAMIALSESMAPVNIVSLAQILRDRELLEKVGGVTYIAALPDAAPSASNIEYYLEILEEKSILRGIIKTCTQAVSEAYDSGGNVEDTLSRVETSVLAIRRLKTAKTPCMRTLVAQAQDDLERMYMRQGEIAGLPTGYIDIDAVTDGLKESEVIVLAAYPGGGKSTMAMNIVEHVSIDKGIPAAFFSMEMAAKRIVMRMLSSRSKVNLRNVKKGIMSEDDFKNLTTNSLKLSGAPIYFDDSADLTISQFRAKARRLVQQFGIKLIVVDYLQLMTCPENSKNREQEVSKMSRGVKMAAQELGIPIIVLSQLNDEGKLRESRSIGQDADQVWVLKIAVDEKGKPLNSSPIATTVELDMQKNRDGEAGGKYQLMFLKQYLRLENAETKKATGE